jgi:hypothetical protein
MKKIILVSVMSMSAALVACGGGDPKSASDKPDNLFPGGVPPVISSSSTSSGSSSSTGSGILNQTIPYHENFDGAANTRQFFSTGYKSLNTYTDLPFYFPAGGFVDEFGNPSPTATSWITGDSNRKLRIGNGRLTLGQTRLEVGTTSADTSIPTWGEFDLSKSYKVSFCVVQVSPASASNFEIYVDNNTTGGNNSIYGAGNASRILQVATHTLVPGTRQEVLVPATAGGRLIGSSTSFFQFRVSSGGWAVIDDLVIEYAGEPHGFTLPACIAEESLPPEPEAVEPPVAPLAPALEVGNGQLKVSWEAVVGATRYIVAYNTVNSVEGAILLGDSEGNGEQEITTPTTQISGLENGTTYYVFVKALNTGGESAFSPSAAAAPEIPATAPEIPVGLQVYGGSQSALVTWAETDGAESYSLAVNTQNETTTATVTDGITETYKRLTGLVNDTPYYVFVKAVNAVGGSDYTAAQAITPTASPYIYQANFAVSKDLFFGTNGPAVQTLGADSEIPLHFIAGGGSGITLEEGGIRLAAGGRFTIGQVVSANEEGVLTQINTAATDTSVNGVLDLSGYYKIVINVVSAPDNTGLFQVYLDNNTASGGNSIHQTTAASRLINRTANSISDGEEIVYEMTTDRRGTATSFIQLRVDSGMGAEGILISGVRIEAIDAPVESSSSAASELSSAPASSASSSSVQSTSSAQSISSAQSSEVVSSSSAPVSSSSVDSSSSLSSAPVGGGSSSAGASSSVAASAILSEDFAAADADSFFSIAYKTMPADTSKSLYSALSGGSRITVANGELSMNNARFAVGDLSGGAATAANVQPNGAFDLSQPYRVKFTVLAATGTGNFQVYVDNNTTGAGNSIHAELGNTASRLLQLTPADITSFPYEVIIESAVGTANSFFQLRADSNITNLVIDNLVIEYQ